VDETPPTIGITPITGDNIVNLSEARAGFAISGSETGADGQTVTVHVLNSSNQVVDSYMTVATAGTWLVGVSSADATALADGTYTVAASVSDSAGNPATATQALTVDETPPTIAIATIAGDNVVNLSEARAGFAISGTESRADGQIVIVQIRDSSNHVVDSYTTTAAGGLWSVSVSSAQATALADGAYNVTASVSDAAGNPATATRTLTVDETLPTIAIALIAGDDVINLSEAQAGFAISGTESGADGQIVTVQILDSSNHVVDSYTTTAAAGTWSVSVSSAQATALADGTYQVIAGVSDAAGNPASPAVRTLTVDETPPTITIATIAGDNVVNLSEAQAGFAISGIESGADGRTVIVQILNNSNNVIDTYTTVATGGTWSVSVSSVDATTLADGTYKVLASVSDTAGNPATAAQTLSVDETPPTITMAPINGGDDIDLTDAEAGFVISGKETGADGQLVTVTILNSNGGAVATYTVTASAGAWSINVSSTDALGLADGIYTVTASISDAAGNPATPATQTLIVDEDTDTWTSASNGNWSATSHWGNGVPTTSTDVAIDAPGIYTISISQPAVARSLTVDAAGATIKDDVSLVLSNALKIISGTFELNNGSLQTSLISIALAGVFLVEHGTYALSAPIATNGQFILDSNGTTVDITGALSGLGSFTINTGATLQFGTGAHTISGSTTDNGKVEVTSGTLEIAGSISGTGSLQVDAGAALQLDGADSLNVAFTSSTGKLILKDPSNFTGTISGLTGNDQIDIANINWQAAQVSSVSYSPTTNVTTLVITDGQHTSTILLVGDYTSSTWTFSSDGTGGTIVVDPLKTVVALSVTDSTATVDTTTSHLDPVHSSNSGTADEHPQQKR
jgi:hypothetical protein